MGTGRWAGSRLVPHFGPAVLVVLAIGHSCHGADDVAAESLRKEADALAKQGNTKMALTKMASAVAKASGKNAKVRLASGMLYARVSQMDKALTDYRAAVQAGERSPGSEKYVAMAHNNICVELDVRGQYDDAYNHCQKAATLPSFWYPHKTLGLIADKWSNVDEAKRHFLEAHRIKRNDALRLHAATILPLVYDSESDLDRRRKASASEVKSMLSGDVVIPDPLADLVTVPHFYSAFFGTNNVNFYRNIVKVLLKSDATKPADAPTRLAYVAPFVANLRKSGQSRVPGRTRVKIGFSSMFFREHASGRMIQGVLAGLDRKLFEVVVFCIKEKPGSAPYTGIVADRIRRRADKYIELPKYRGLAFMRSTIEAEKLDILVFAEIGMDPGNYLLAFARLAPTQVVTHGHASTTGIPTLDYYVSYKPFEAEDAQKFYTEKLVTFSDFSPYYRPELPSGIPSRRELFSNLGLGGLVSDETTVLVCLQTLFKLTPNFDTVFREILQRLPKARLLLKTFRSAKVNEKLKNRLKQTMPDVYDRITILPGLSGQQWYGLLRHGDIVLDSYPFGGYTTTLEVLAAGSTPIVTLPHDQMAGRCTKGFFDLLGIDDTIASSKAEYVAITERLVTDKEFRTGVQAQLESTKDAIWERQTTVREWEEFLTQVANGQSITNLHTARPTWQRIRTKRKQAVIKTEL
eukprot:m.36738 g.36738  ORF g.36738 m.36738 type:complete len:691 (+) comp7609_c0_seq1:62-2134(+)